MDGSDYSRIDTNYPSKATGWNNGDFNYDGAVNGSDYTLIDNAFNTQGIPLTAQIAASPASLVQAKPVTAHRRTAVANTDPDDDDAASKRRSPKKTGVAPTWVETLPNE